VTAVRSMVVWCPDWPVTAAVLEDGLPVDAPIAVLHANRVVATSLAARTEGVRRGLRKREAQHRCPQLTILAADDSRDARAFEPVLAAVEEVAAGVEVLRPGACALAARGPARYCGGEEAAAEQIIEQIAQACGLEAQLGIADGIFAAGLAARTGRVVPPGGTASFLAEVPVTALGRPPLADLLRRLGITTLGAFAALPAADVLSRFGADGAWAHRIAGGRDTRTLALRQPPPDLEVTAEYDEPLDRVDRAAFAARALAERLHERLASYGLACTQLGIEAVTANGARLFRAWRHDGLLTAAAIADRVRWQLDGWLSSTNTARPSSGLVRLRLLPDGITRQLGQQPGLWGEPGEEQQRAHRALTRVQGLLGPESVVTAVPDGGRAPGEQCRLVPWGESRQPGPAAASPWPGRLPTPAPAMVLPQPIPAMVWDADDRPVQVSARLAVSAAPQRLALAGAPPVEISGWAGPWPADERWWAPQSARRQARFQVQLVDGRAVLLFVRAGQWGAEAFYD